MMKIFISMSAKTKAKAKHKKSTRSVFLKALMGRIDEDLSDAFAHGDVKGFQSQFDDLKNALISKMQKNA